MEKALVQPYLRPLAPIPTQVKQMGRLRKPIDCLLCDLYGTLFISSSGDIGLSSHEPRQTELLDKLMVEYDLKTTAAALQDQLTQAIKGHHTLARTRGVPHPEVVIETIWQELLPNERPDKVRRFAIEYEMITNPVWPMPGLEALVSACRNKGIRMGIISNAQFYTPHLFSWLLGREPEALGFDARLSIYSFQHGEAKPSATLFELARQRLREMAIAPSGVAYIGNDMRNDIMPAHQAGFQSILFAGDERSLRLRKKDPTCQAMTPDMVVTGLAQLASYLREPSLMA